MLEWDNYDKHKKDDAPFLRRPLRAIQGTRMEQGG